MLDGEDVYRRELDVVPLRVRVGMVFQKPNPFPKSIDDNVGYGPRIHGLANGTAETDVLVQASLEKAGLWEEEKDRLDQPGTGLSGGQQRRLCIARAIAVSPEAILMDEPCSALDPIATARIEELIVNLLARRQPVARDLRMVLSLGKSVADMEYARNVGHTIDVTFALEALERIGDHAKNIAGYVIFLVKAKDVRHVSPESIEREVLDEAG